MCRLTKKREEKEFYWICLNNMLNKLIIILGPTASGKSDLAIKLAKKFNGEIVSADSRQIYQEMDIGTAKVTKEEMAGIPHYLIDIIKPNQEFTLAQYKKLAVKIIKDIQKRNKLPFLVGGTGLYIQAIVDNLQIPEVKPDKKLRSKLEKKTNHELFEQLKKLDPQALKIIDINNKRRMIRAVEVCLKTKKPFSQQRKKGQHLFNACQIGLKLDKETLEKKIDQRAEKMFQVGLIEEAKKLAKKYNPDLPSMSSIGYQEIIQYLDNKITLEQTKKLIKTHTNQYARRQMIWFKRDKRIKWIKNYSQAEKLTRNFLL
jgi:tRNA dimethylallyltransferase